MRIAISFCFLIVGLTSIGQQYGWKQEISASTQHECGGQSVVTDNAGNVYTTGFFGGNIQSNPIVSFTGDGTPDLYVTKHDSNGNLIWTYTTYTSSNGGVFPTDIKISSDGSIVVVGSFGTTAYTNFNPSGTASNLTPGTYDDVFILKLSNSGVFSWVKKVGGFGYHDYANALDVDNSGSIYIVGRFKGVGNYSTDPFGSYTITSNGGYDGFTLKLSSNGDFEWVKQIGGLQDDEIKDIVVNSDGNVVLTGYFSGNVDFDSGGGLNMISSNNQTHDIFIVEYSPLGLQGDVAIIGGNDTDRGISLDADNQGNIYLAGIFSGNVNFNPNPNGNPYFLSGVNSSAFTLSLNSSLNLNWVNSFNSTTAVNPVSICVKSSKIYLTGSFLNNVDFDPSSSDFTLNTNSNITDIYIVKLSTNGDFISAFDLNSTLFSNQPAQIDVDNSNSILLTGYVKGYLDIDPGPNLLNIYGDNYWTAYTLKLLNSCSSTFSVLNPFSCAQYTAPDGQIFTQSGQYTSTLTNASGCDSIVSINLTITQPTTSTITVSSCGSYISPSGTVFTSSGIYSDTIGNVSGCDSIVSINLTINNPSFSSSSITSCGAYTSPSGNVWSTSGIYTDTLQNANGCDSIISINLTVNTVDTTVTKSGFTLTANQASASYQWYNCTTNTPINGATSQSFTATSSGWYSVLVTANGCSEMSQCKQIKKFNFNVNFGMNDLFEITENRFLVYPNPFSNSINISSESQESFEIRIIDIRGREVFNSENETEIPLEFLEAGMYQLTILQNETLEFHQIVKL